jgi:hypothetical protein
MWWQASVDFGADASSRKTFVVVVVVDVDDDVADKSTLAVEEVRRLADEKRWVASQ